MVTSPSLCPFGWLAVFIDLSDAVLWGNMGTMDRSQRQMKRYRRIVKQFKTNFTHLPESVSDRELVVLTEGERYSGIVPSALAVFLGAATSFLDVTSVSAFSVESFTPAPLVAGVAVGAAWLAFDHSRIFLGENGKKGSDILLFINQTNPPTPYWASYVKYRRSLRSSWLTFEEFLSFEERAKGVKSVEDPVTSNSNNIASSHAWNPFMSSLDAIKGQLMDWEMDILRVVQYPSLFDLGIASTRDFHESLNYAEKLKPSVNDAFDLEHPFLKALSSVEASWKYAQSDALRAGITKFAPDERKRVERALGLLRIALDVSGSPSERQVSYKRALKELEGLIHVPENSVKMVESMVFAGMIEA